MIHSCRRDEDAAAELGPKRADDGGRQKPRSAREVKSSPHGGGDVLEMAGPAGPLAEGRLLSPVHPQLDPERAD